MKIVFLPEVLEYFNELSTVLYEKKYFGFEDSALEYVDDLFENIKNTLHLCVKKPAPAYFDRFGENMLYAVFRKNKMTEWYVFFNLYREEDDTTLVIRYISNNHVIAQYL
ncbi:MAG: hypothetical protein LBV32_05370 [Tannerellaceae bacterium]|jgi:hypothetical protein|nr:hypothetical protein [Tannerellaceae bacterium]